MILSRYIYFKSVLFKCVSAFSVYSMRYDFFFFFNLISAPAARYPDTPSQSAVVVPSNIMSPCLLGNTRRLLLLYPTAVNLGATVAHQRYVVTISMRLPDVLSVAVSCEPGRFRQKMFILSGLNVFDWLKQNLARG